MFKKRILAISIIGLLITLSAGSVLADINASYPDRITIDGVFESNILRLSWSKSDDPHFKRYHIIFSESDRNSEYLEETTVWSTDDINEMSHEIKIKEDSNPYYRVCVNNTSNKSTCSNILHINEYNIVRNFSVYQDINSDAWYKEYADDLQSKFILPIYDRTFEGGKKITRGEFAEWLVRAVANEDEITPQSEYFCDVHANQKYINYLRELEVVGGYTGGNCATRKLFKPNQPINRAEALKIIIEVFKVQIKKSNIDYADNTANSNIAVDVNQKQWFAKYVYWAQKDGVVDTNIRGYFRPETPLNRAEAAKILSKAIRKYQ